MSRKNKKKKAKKLAALESSKAIRGIERKEHFDNGGTLAQWRGTHSVHTSRANKRKTRATERKKAIQESSDE